MRGIDLLEELDENIPDFWRTEPRRMKQILLNLTGNAMKFTFDGYIKIKADMIKVEDNSCIKVIIEDTGIGIREGDIGKLFKMFSMVESSKDKNQSGTGLGLMISNKLSMLLTYKGGPGI